MKSEITLKLHITVPNMPIFFLPPGLLCVLSPRCSLSSLEMVLVIRLKKQAIQHHLGYVNEMSTDKRTHPIEVAALVDKRGMPSRPRITSRRDIRCFQEQQTCIEFCSHTCDPSRLSSVLMCIERRKQSNFTLQHMKVEGSQCHSPCTQIPLSLRGSSVL